MNNTQKEAEFERCVICGELTKIPIATPIEWRENYLVGLGQLCDRCTNNKCNE